MVKLVVWTLIGTTAVFCGILWLNHARTRDPGCLIGYAVEPAKGDSAALHVLISGGMAGESAGGNDEEAWIDRHLALRDAADEPVELRRAVKSSLISGRKARDARFFVTARLKQGETYVLDYSPDGPMAKRYRHVIAVTATGEPFQRVYFKLVKE